MARKNTTKPTSLLVILKGRKPIDQASLSLDLMIHDHLALFSSSDLTPVTNESGTLASPLSAWRKNTCTNGKPIDKVQIRATNGTSNQLKSLLEEIKLIVSDNPSIQLTGFKISGSTFQLLLTIFESIKLIECSLGRGWWLPTTIQKCSHLSVIETNGVAPPTERSHRRPKSRIKSLSTSSRTISSDIEGKIGRNCCSDFCNSFLGEFWGTEIESLSIGGDSWEELAQMVVPLNLKTIELYPVTEEAFAWVVRNSNLENMSLFWDEDTHLPWHKIKTLKSLKSLYVMETPLTDAEFEVISDNSQLALVMAYYTKLTSRSIPTLLRWSSLRCFWGSDHMIGPINLLDLPETTNLKEFVALNARTQWFREFFKGYPNLTVVEM